MRALLVSLLLLPLGACAEAPAPAGVDQAKYADDLADCRAVADLDQPEWQAAQGVAIGTGFGAAIGAVIGGFGYGSLSPAVWWGMLAGGGAGLVAGGAAGIEAQNDAVDACLRERGYPEKMLPSG